MADGLLQPRIGGLYHGVSRQAPLLRSPNQMQELDNFLPSVDVGGIVDRTGSRAIMALPRASYHSAPSHHFFRTTDGQRWVCLRRIENGSIEVRNLVNGAPAALTYGPWVQNYIGGSSNLKFLTLSDTTFILNPDVVVTCTEQPVPELTACYVVIKKLSSAAQSFSVTSQAGAANFMLTQGQGSIITRDFAAAMLTNQIVANMPGIAAWRVAGNVIKMSGSAAAIESVRASNDWDETAMGLIKGRVSATSDLPGSFEAGVPIKVDLGFGDADTAYYVSYDAAINAWVECSYTPNKGTTADLHPGTLPIRLHQVGVNSFELQPCPWTPRKTGSTDSNPVPTFVGKRITAFAQWKGRLWFGSDDTVMGSQPDDLFNFFRDSAREVKPADPVILTVESPDLGVVQHLVAFRNKLMVMSDTAQLEVPGDKPVTPEDATIGVATRYPLDRNCTPAVIGDSLFYTGTTEGRSALWEYSYDEASANNTAFDLSKHVPGYVPGRVGRIRGSAQAGRTFIWAPGDPARLYVNTGYWKDGQRAQNAWSKLSFPFCHYISDHWVYEDTLYVLAVTGSAMWVFTIPVDATLGDVPANDMRLDFNTQVQITWNSARNRSEVIIPSGFMDFNPHLVILVDRGDTWFHEVNVTCIWDGTQWVGHFPSNYGTLFGRLGVRFARTAIFSPFYPSMGESVTPEGRLQVRTVVVDALVSCDFVATVTRPDRTPMRAPKSPRSVGEALVPDRGYNVQHRVPFNSQGDKAQLAITTTSTGPMALTGFTLLGRYTNPTAS